VSHVPKQSSSGGEIPRPVILGAGLSGLAVSRALSTAGIEHVLVGDPPNETPRLGESLNAEGSLEIARQFPALARYFFDKQRVALFFGEHALAFESFQACTAPVYYTLFGYPKTAPLLHVDRIGFDRALFEAAVADNHCLHMQGPPRRSTTDPTRTASRRWRWRAVSAFHPVMSSTRPIMRAS
jgi:hypothetical protein